MLSNFSIIIIIVVVIIIIIINFVEGFFYKLIPH